MQGYNARLHLNDIAVLRLSRVVASTPSVGRICLPPPSPTDTYEERQAVVAGWGTTEFLGKPSASLLEVSVPVWNNDACFTALGKNIFNSTLCAGGREKPADACQVKHRTKRIFAMDIGPIKGRRIV